MSKKTDNITVLIPVDLRDRAHRMGFNISAVCRRAVTEVVERFEHQTEEK